MMENLGEEEDVTPDDYLDSYTKASQAQDLLSPSQFTSQSQFLSWVLESDKENMQNGGKSSDGTEGSVLSRSTTLETPSSLGSGEVPDLSFSSGDFRGLGGSTSESDKGFKTEEAETPDLFTFTQSTASSLPAISEQEVIDALGIEEGCSPDMFSQTSEESPVIPDRDYFIEQERMMLQIQEKYIQEQKDRTLAKLLSKGIDATQKRSLRKNSN